MLAGRTTLSECLPDCLPPKAAREPSESGSEHGWAVEESTAAITSTFPDGPAVPAKIAAYVGLRVLQKVISDDKVDPVTRKDLEFVKYAIDGLLLCGDETLKAKTPPSALPLLEGPLSSSTTVRAKFESMDGLDGETTRWLAKMNNDERVRATPRFVHIGRVVMMSIRWRKATQDPNSDKKFDVPLLSKNLGEKLQSWSGFDAFQLDDLTGGHAMAAICDTLFWKRGLLEAFPIRKDKLRNYWFHIEGMYRANPYHCTCHAIDVVHAAHLLLLSGLQEGMTEIEILSILFASAVHDVGHPGVTNDFRIAEGDEDAITFNDRSVNENMSLWVSFLGLQVPSNNFLDEFAEKQVVSIRKMVVQTVLATDMATHFENVELFKEQIKKQGTDVLKWTDRKTLLEAIVHAADLSNPCRGLSVSCNWTNRVLKEFFAQGDRERALGRPVTALCDRYVVSRPESQVGFISFIVRPYYVELQNLCAIPEGMNNLAQTFQYWSNEKEKEKVAKEVAKQALEGKKAPNGDK